MKKLLAVLLVMLMIVGCTKPNEGSDKIEVALLIGGLGDMSFNDSANEGLERAKKDFGDKINVTVIEYGNDDSKVEPALLDAAEGKYNFIIGSSSVKTYLEKHAADFPDKHFVMFDETIDYETYPLSNVYSIQYKANEPSYLVGFVGAKMSETGVLGFLGGQPFPIIYDFFLGFIEGAQAANPDIKIAEGWVGGWSDAAKGKDLSIAMVNDGADIIFGVAGGAGTGAIELAAETEGVLAIGVDSDQALVFESQGKQNYADAIITSALKNVGDSLYRAIDLHLKGDLKFGEAEVLGIKENGVGLAVNKYYEDMVSKEIRDAAEELRLKVVNGEITVTSAYGMEQSAIDEIVNSVKP